MFTGIIERTGTLLGREAAQGGARLEIAPSSPISDLEIGESISVNGVCLTAEPGSKPDRLVFFVSAETIGRSTLGEAAHGTKVNLERSLGVGDRMGGHIVLGHVDGIGTVRRWERRGEAWHLECEYPKDLAPLIALKGSIAVDGISLTVATLGPDAFSVAVIPHTVAETNLEQMRPGARVNLEADVIARYVQRALETKGANPQQGLTLDTLREAGF
ncbi:riboflavin synthase [bacterium]|nr:riboflavin synthase [bacterium]